MASVRSASLFSLQIFASHLLDELIRGNRRLLEDLNQARGKHRRLRTAAAAFAGRDFLFLFLLPPVLVDEHIRCADSDRHCGNAGDF